MTNAMNAVSKDLPYNGKDPLPTGRSARARFAILKALDELGGAAGASKISEMLGGSGIDLQARSIRFHLLKMDRDGLTRSVARHEGRLITETGRKELARISVMRKVGFISSKMDELGYRMSLNTENGKGTVVSNAALINKRDLSRSLHYMKPVFASGFSMGDRIAVKMAGERIGDIDSRFGGLIEMDAGVPKRFIELTEYQGTSIDPHKIFIMANLTKVSQCAGDGSGVIGVSFREFPSVAIDQARRLIGMLRRLNLNGILAIGQPNRPLLDIPVSEGRTGMIAIDGLNPIAALHEAGIPVELSPLSGLEELGTFVSFTDVAPMGKRTTFVD
jgi:repressor of nif and glnA expression